jgi:hypothetical protein
MTADSLTRNEIIEVLEATGDTATSQTRQMKNTGKFRECLYLNGELAGKEQAGGTYKLCNNFTELIK